MLKCALRVLLVVVVATCVVAQQAGRTGRRIERIKVKDRLEAHQLHIHAREEVKGGVGRVSRQQGGTARTAPGVVESGGSERARETTPQVDVQTSTPASLANNSKGGRATTI